MMRILGIETSCDETAASVLEVNRGHFKILSNVVASQVKLHAKTRGVVPEVAARAHLEQIIPVIDQTLFAAYGISHMAYRKSHKQYAISNMPIDAIAVTTGPGLLTSLLVGIETARTLSYLWKKPVAAVNHLAGHVYANWLSLNKSVRFPALALIVSGGHTELVLMKKHLDFKIIGQTRDDAAGECFDKVAKMLNLGYPGGPAVSACAAQSRSVIARSKTTKQSRTSTGSPRSDRNVGARDDINLPRPMIDSPDFDFSFSGLKTSVLYLLKQNKNIGRSPALINALCAEVETAITDVLVSKTIRAAKKYKVKTVLLGGGVAANKTLRLELGKAVKKQLPTTHYLLPSLPLCTDNAAMIAAAGYFMAKEKQFTPWQRLKVNPNLSL